MDKTHTQLPTTSGRPLNVGARLRYRRAYSAQSSPLDCEWREHTGIVTSINETDNDVRVAISAETGLHHARFIRLGDGSLQMDSSKYVAEILAPAAPRRAAA